MGTGAKGAASGVVFGLAAVFFGQQLGLIDLSSLSSGLFSLVLGALLGGLFFGLAGALLGRRYLNRHRPVAEWTPSPPAPEPEPGVPQEIEESPGMGG